MASVTAVDPMVTRVLVGSRDKRLTSKKHCPGVRTGMLGSPGAVDDAVLERHEFPVHDLPPARLTVCGVSYLSGSRGTTAGTDIRTASAMSANADMGVIHVSSHDP